MLFAIKNRLVPTLLLLVLFVALAFGLRDWLGLDWRLGWHARLLIDLLLGALVLGGSDAGGHLLLALTLGDAYWSRYRALVNFFRPQHLPQIIAGGLLAGGEELIFRGVLLEGLRSLAGMPSLPAVGLTALVFGLCHTIPKRLLWPFTFWAIWEGALLGGIYVVSGSLLVVVVLHVLHDIAGFSVFALQRQRWTVAPRS